MSTAKLAAVLAVLCAGGACTEASAGDGQKQGDPPREGATGQSPDRPVVVTTPVWKRTTIGLPPEDDLDAKQRAHQATIEWTTDLYASVIRSRRKAGKPLIPPAVPVPSDDCLVYANAKSIAVLAMKDDRAFDPPVRRGELLWAQGLDSSWNLLRDLERHDFRATWIGGRRPEQVDLLLNQTLNGAVSVGKSNVYFIEDLAIPPGTEMAATVAGERFEFRIRDFPLVEEIFGNQVKVADIPAGKLRFVLRRNRARTKDPAPFGGNIYLGAPLGIDSSTILIHEKGKRVRVTSINWEEVREEAHRHDGDIFERILNAASKIARWDTELVTAPTSVVGDPHRRIHAIHLTEADGLVICPTHLGRVVAVDAATGKVRWAHEYAPVDAKRFPSFAPEWVVVPPVVTGGRYVYAPADFPELLCLNVADGKKVWTTKRGDGLYPAVVGDRVLVVGEKTVRSLTLKDGSEQWRLDLPGLPCGRGAVLGDTYLVPVSEPKTWKGLIAVVDPKAGKVVEVLRPEKDEPIGNLVVHQDFLLSQTLTEIAAFPLKRR